MGPYWVPASAFGPKFLKWSLSFRVLTCKMGRANNTSPVRLCLEITFKYFLCLFFSPHIPSCPSFLPRSPATGTHTAANSSTAFISCIPPPCLSLGYMELGTQTVNPGLTLSNLLVGCKARTRPWSQRTPCLVLLSGWCALPLEEALLSPEHGPLRTSVPLPPHPPTGPSAEAPGRAGLMATSLPRQLLEPLPAP